MNDCNLCAWFWAAGVARDARGIGQRRGTQRQQGGRFCVPPCRRSHKPTWLFSVSAKNRLAAFSLAGAAKT